ncbi:glycine--tRNA ligase subunit beta [Hankyongella ginsenosidimutans]|uniref:Glycine--tRNA ligase subunit beta n=1 Tax=Hankyongella ginsenosidimutans TaxID=1763828 RepID=A0A4D7C736_9SPHN|nr:glycine--tRNA ligase subunit beta [Hankyongella ginsenosidimutans]
MQLVRLQPDDIALRLPLVREERLEESRRDQLEVRDRRGPEVLATLIPPSAPSLAEVDALGRALARSRQPESIICLLDGAVVPLELEGLKADSITRGHRFHGNAPFRVDDFEGYRTKL